MVDGASRLVEEPLGSNCEAIVVIPVRDEENRLWRCLCAFSVQQAVRVDQFELILLLNNCTDGSATLARRFADSHPEISVHLVSRQLPATESNIGTVRRLLMDEAWARFSTSSRRASGAIMTTDGDTAVDSHWVAHNLAELRLGADAVGGRISLDTREMRSLVPRVRKQYRWDLMYGLLRAQLESELDPVPWDPWPRHHQNFCGSLAITSAMYEQVGGVPHVQNLEDLALCESVIRAEGKIRHSPFVQVRTSARLDGRVGIGLSSHLRGFEGDEPPMVETVALAAAKFRASHDLRERAAIQTERDGVCKLIEEAWKESRQMPIEAAVQELCKLALPPGSRINRHSQI